MRTHRISKCVGEVKPKRQDIALYGLIRKQHDGEHGDGEILLLTGVDNRNESLCSRIWC
ncbi:MAG: hypothetical protein IPK01_11160 [Acidobacteria bacterium]|nr:hypothetical protein [Acidobacteriota bacterium]